MASVGLTKSGRIMWFLAHGIWPASAYAALEEKGARLASKMTTLEMLGLLLPLLSVLTLLAGQHVVLGVDNIGVVFGWQNGGCKGDRWASVLIRALHIMASFLGCTVHVTHMPRLSMAAAVMADSLTRSSTATAKVWAQTAGDATYGPLPTLWEWLLDPSDDWHLGYKLVNDLKHTAIKTQTPNNPPFFWLAGLKVTF
jgi:succinate dehydrogenase/fumarate reductase cytochrome b subunit